MTRLANEFIDPKTAEVYPWPVNHESESEANLARSISTAANTAGTQLVRQQGVGGPLTFQLTGAIFLKSQLEKFIHFYNLCESQTIYFKKYSGDEFEVQITDFKPVEVKTIHNPKDSTNAPLWYWRYTMTLEVITVRSGVFAGIVT